ncbi:MAG: M48 family metallopeptidase [Pyrinomonadaceae bacterium]
MHKKFLVLLMSVVLFLTTVPAGLAAATSKPKKVKIRGYITDVISPTSFEIDQMKVKRDSSLVLDFENQTPEVNFKPEDIRVGTEIEVEGYLDEETEELNATKITVDLEQFGKLKNTSVLTRDAAGIEKTEGGWQGVLRADGRRIRIEPTTQVLFELNKSEKKEAEAEARKDKKKKEEEEETGDEFDDSEPLKSIADVRAGMFATYEGVQQADGTVLASRIVFWKNELEEKEGKFWDSLKIQEKAANFAQGKPGELKIDKVGKFKLLPDDEVQKYVQNLGEKLIPAHQKNLADDDPQKIPFKFFVISDSQANAFATANGIVVVNSGMIALLENEAQLAAVMSHEIAHATQEHTWRQLNKDKGKRTAIAVGGVAAAVFGLSGVSDILQLTLSAMVNGYQRRLENQADRIGLEYLVAAGYDPREAPRVWKIMAKRYGDAPTNFFWSSHSNHATRRSFLMVEIRNNYSDMDLNSMNRGSEEEFQKIKLQTEEASKKKKKK